MKTFVKYIITIVAVIYIGMLIDVQGANQCFFNGLSLDHNQTTIGYKYSNIPYGSSYNCNTLLQEYESFICNDGILQGQHGGIPSLYTNNYCIDQQPQSCTLGNFGQQIYVPHYNGGIPTVSDLGTYLFTGYKKSIVENISSCSLVSINSIVPGDNTYVYCKNGVLKDLIQYNIFSSEQNFNQNNYPYSQCNQIKNSDCLINNTIIKNGESMTFFQSNDSTQLSCNSQIRTCTNGILSGSYYHTNCFNYNGTCGDANGKYYSKTPLINLCAVGTSSTITPVFNINTNQRTRSCLGSQGTNENCVAYKINEAQGSGQCKVYPGGLVTLNPESQFLCTLGEVSNINSTTLGRTWTCSTEYGDSPQCSTKKSLIATGNISYSFNRDNSITASVINISPYGAYIINNNNSNSKRFTQNGTFIFQIKFNDSITDIIAQVNSINNRTMKIKDLIQDYRSNICNTQKNIIIKESSQYNLLDVQTMVNHCLLNIKQSTNGYNINMKKNITRGEFVISAYNFIKTIRPYNNTSYNINSSSYKGVPNESIAQEAIKRLITTKGDQYINHTTSRNTATYKRNNYITSKEIYNLVTYILNIHDDNDIYFKSLWEKEVINNTMKWSQYANLMRRVLEQYDRIALGNNIIALENLENRVIGLSTINQNNELQEIYNTLHSKDPTKFEKTGLSKRSLLNDINTIINNGISNKKTILSISLQDVINKSKSNLTITKQEKTKALFKKMSY